MYCGRFQGSDKLLLVFFLEAFINDRISQLGLAGEIVVEGTLADICAGQNFRQARSLKAAFVNFAECRLNQGAPSLVALFSALRFIFFMATGGILTPFILATVDARFVDKPTARYVIRPGRKVNE